MLYGISRPIMKIIMHEANALKEIRKENGMDNNDNKNRQVPYNNRQNENDRQNQNEQNRQNRQNDNRNNREQQNRNNQNRFFE